MKEKEWIVVWCIAFMMGASIGQCNQINKLNKQVKALQGQPK